jgi:hypothetical protein
MNFSKKVKANSSNSAHESGEDAASKHSSTNSSSTNPQWSQLSQGSILSSAPPGVIQREEKDEEKGEDQGLNYEFIPPKVGYKLGDFSASADTAGANLGYDAGGGTLGLGYNYGEDFSASAKYEFLDGKLAYNPSSEFGSLSLGGKHEGFKYGLGADTSGKGNLSFGGSHGGFNYSLGANTGGSGKASFGFGAPLAPMPSVFGQQALGAGNAIPGVLGSMPGIMDDPMGTYAANGERIDALKKFGGTAADLYKTQQKGKGALPFGVGFGLGYDPLVGPNFTLGAQGHF